MIISGIIIIGGSFQVEESKPEFCKTCHEMEFQYDTWKTSTHVDEANCLDCHTEPSVRGYIDAKMRALTELIAHITGKYEVPIRSNIRVLDPQCLKCHPNAAEILDVSVEVNHEAHVENDILCVECHSRIVHAADGEPNVIQSQQCEGCHNSHIDFPIKGEHEALSCSECHLYGVYEAISPLCQDCHDVPDNHVERVYSNCEACHTDTRWDAISFDHVKVSLKGGHEGLECIDCHQTDGYSGLSPDCESCHDLPKPHVETNVKNCIDCHTVNGWSPAEFDHTAYELTGRHLVVRCGECHINEQYTGAPEFCADCHKVPTDHAALIDDACDLCHVTDDWSIVTFEHESFQLIDGHADIACIECHPDNTYEPVYSLCEDCHTAPINHAVNADTDCEACHTISGWTPADFDHSTYQLSGAHEDVDCVECHSNGVYYGTPRNCVSCHSEPAYHSGLPDCADCHTTATWSSSTYKHPYIEEHYPRGEKQLSCNTCHPSTYSEYTCTGAGCHSSNNPRDDD